jgi:hypothetical protein
VRRPPVPAFIAELFAEPVARNGLLAGSAALFAPALWERQRAGVEIFPDSIPATYAAWSRAFTSA